MDLALDRVLRSISKVLLLLNGGFELVLMLPFRATLDINNHHL